MNMYEMWEIQEIGRSNRKEENSRVEIKIPSGIISPTANSSPKKRGRPRKNAK